MSVKGRDLGLPQASGRLQRLALLVLQPDMEVDQLARGIRDRVRMRRVDKNALGLLVCRRQRIDGTADVLKRLEEVVRADQQLPRSVDDLRLVAGLLLMLPRQVDEPDVGQKRKRRDEYHVVLGRMLPQRRLGLQRLH